MRLQAFTRGDGVKIAYGGLAITSLRSAISPGDTLPGVVIEDAGGRNGPGVGILTLTSGAAGPYLSWRAPGSIHSGVAQPVFYDGDYLLEDGDDPQKYLRLSVYPKYLPAARALPVYLMDTYNGLAPFDTATNQDGDISAANAAAGLAMATLYFIENGSPVEIQNVKLWLDSSAAGFAYLSVSSDGSNYYQPTSEDDTHALSWSSIATGGVQLLYIKRTTPAAMSANTGILNVIKLAWTGL